MVKEGLESSNLLRWFNLRMSDQTFAELALLQSFMHEVKFQEDLLDVWAWQGTTKSYTPKMFYTYAHRTHTFNPVHNWIWTSSCILNLKVFAWMLVMDRINTKDMVETRHKHLDDGVNSKI